MGTVIDFPDRPHSVNVAQAVGRFDQDVAHVVEAVNLGPAFCIRAMSRTGPRW